MSDEITPSAKNSLKPGAVTPPRVRRISNPRPKKVTKAEEPEVEAPPVAEMVSIPFPTARKIVAPVEAPQPVGNDWPEPEEVSMGDAATQTESAKRKRRRRKGKGQSNNLQNGAEPGHEELHVPASPEPKSSESAQEQRPRPPIANHLQPQPQRLKIDPELLTKMAWKIYLAEVSEEGVALIGDNDAKDLSRRCFRLAEIFIEEQGRRR